MGGSDHDQEVPVIQTQGFNGNLITPNSTISFELLRFSPRQMSENDFGGQGFSAPLNLVSSPNPDAERQVRF
jgi:hypothetical protein